MAFKKLYGMGFLVAEMVRRDLRVRYAGSALGFTWAFANPLFWVILYGFVFGVILRVPLSGEPAGVTFPEFLLAGLLPWIAIQESISRSASSIPDNAAMVKKTVFPLEALIASIVIASLVNELVALLVFGAYLAFLGHLSFSGVLLLAPALAIQGMLSFGLGCMVATVTAFVRDAAHVVGLALTALFYAIPIVYPIDLVPARYPVIRALLRANPLTQLIEWFRDALYRRQLPPAGAVVSLSLTAAATVALGALLFARAKPHFVDLV
jgi:homopolymeric O-antigen transport system permease protein